jgi:hypothetical protein
MTSYSFTPAETTGRNAFDTATKFTFDCESSRGGLYRVNATVGDCGSAVAQVFRVRDGQGVCRTTRLGNTIHTLAVQHALAATTA